ncbi:PREDICTED: uncharacterized protein LOC109175392 [Ipomoea nil]|uniref:uncharacterized protein LOC109175392 n=1 Tax=Ipomoea nil TaxID=35883 RepID=UPI0009009439|nr:PREDICTED: uncharacterized protein LOC109175392 [Ipomoea nil]
MRQPPGYEDPVHPDYVCHLQRSLYGLKQAPRAWFHRLHEFLLSTGFVASKTDVSLFYYTVQTSRVYLLVYVDDIIMMGNDSALLTTLLARPSAVFKIRDLGTPTFFLGIETVPIDGGLLLSQRRYMDDILTRAGMVDCKSLSTPAAITKAASPSTAPYENPTQYRRLAGALQYLTITRPDLSFAVNRLCQFMHAPTEEHWGCPVDRKSTSRYAVFLGTNLVSWVSRKQRTVARSSTEAEYKGLADVAAEVTWVMSLLRELGLHSGSPATLWCDNLGATYMCANLVFHARTKHVEIDYHFVRDKVSSGEFLVNFVSTKDQLADIFTIPLASTRFASLRDKLNVVSLPPSA